MEKYNFDQRLNRIGTESIKWDGLSDFYGNEHLMPFWVADMDFKSPPQVIHSAVVRAEHGIFGYPNGNEPAFSAFMKWQLQRNHITIERNALVASPGVVTALALAIQTFTEIGDCIVIQPPVYTPFFEMIELNERVLVENPLIETADSWVIDFEGLEDLFKTKSPKMMIFCNPHNPLGIVWSKEDVARLARLCCQYEVFLLSDEIHGDLIFSNHSFCSLLSIEEMNWKFGMIATAPSKTFNIAGMFYSILAIKDDERRRAFKRTVEKLHLTPQNAFNVHMAEAAYLNGAAWLEALLSYLEGNAEFLVDYIHANLPQIKVKKPEGTYLAWLDCTALGMDSNTLMEKTKQAGLALSSGRAYGIQGEGCIRFNFGCPREQLAKGLDLLVKALK